MVDLFYHRETLDCQGGYQIILYKEPLVIMDDLVLLEKEESMGNQENLVSPAVMDSKENEVSKFYFFYLYIFDKSWEIFWIHQEGRNHHEKYFYHNKEGRNFGICSNKSTYVYYHGSCEGQDIRHCQYKSNTMNYDTGDNVYREFQKWCYLVFNCNII